LPTGAEIPVETARDGFDVTWERRVTLEGREVNRYQFTNHYVPSHNVIAVGGTGSTATPSPTPTAAATPLRLVGPTPNASPSASDLIQVPNLVGMLEVQAKPIIVRAGLAPTTSNYQGPDQVPASILGQYGIGAVISQVPPAGTLVGPATKVYLAVRKL
jgi:hypothetical protein